MPREAAPPVKIAISGNCVAPVLAKIFAVMCPEHRTESVAPDGTPVADPGRYDVVFRQRLPQVANTLQPPRANEIVYPRIVFSAFHPDLVYAHAGAALARSPLGDYHSSLALYGWRSGMTVAQTLALYGEPVYERLGYFDFWESARQTLLAEGEAAGFPLEALFARWRARGCFMHSVNHPVLAVLADVARELARRAGLRITVSNPEVYLADDQADGPVWPVYPEVAARLGVPGSYAFKPPNAPHAVPAILSLERFVADSFDCYAKFGRSEVSSERLDDPAYRELDAIAVSPRAAHGGEARFGASPYAGLPARQFWRSAVEAVPAPELDPAGDPPFAIRTEMRIATAGSCFAQHVSRALRGAGYDFYVAEPSAADDSFSGRYGNVYTARQLLQLFDRAYGAFEPADDVWARPDGRYADPFRPRIEPDGFATVAELLASRTRHLAAVRTMFERLDVFVFTLGLTEAWRSKRDGAVFPVAPGVVAGDADPAAYEFHNFTVAEVAGDLGTFLVRLGAVNSAARVVLTVSPVPLVATYESRHVLASTTYSKSVLRAAAGEIERAYTNVWYFPAYEIVTGTFNRGAYFAPDLRSVTPSAVDHVMRVFLGHCERGAVAAGSDAAARRAAETRRVMDVICDEETIANG